MPTEPQIAGMSSMRRAWFFWGLVTIFLVVLPAMIFYTTGYRFDLFNAETPNIVTTGGIYISTQSTDVEVYLDEEQVERPRLFRSAYYIQNIDAGVRRVVVQGDGIQTWVKEITVDPYIVTEAAAFNVPTVTQIRPITVFQTMTDQPVFFASSTPELLFLNGTSTVPFVIASTTATTSYQVNPEYEFVESLFGTTTTSRTSVFADYVAGLERFGFNNQEVAPADTATTSTSTSTVIEQNDIRLITKKTELYAIWQGDQNDIPYYFCVVPDNQASTSARYGQHVADAVFAELATSTATSSLLITENRICRTEIKLDRLRQDVYLFDFYPVPGDLVLLQLEDGLYVTEIDDRAWQNTQRLFAGSDFETIIENEIIYVKQADQYFEILTEIESN